MSDIDEFHSAYMNLLQCALTLMGAERKLEARGILSTYEMEHLVGIIHALNIVTAKLKNVLERYGVEAKQ